MIFILIFPIILVVFSILLTKAAGPFWQYADPSYIYLLNSINLVKGLPSAYVDHPGALLQLLGQVVISILNLGRPVTQTVSHVLTNPEFYLQAINIVLLILIPISSILLGVAVFRKTKDVTAVLLSQWPNIFLLTLRAQAFNAPMIHAIFGNVDDEPVLLIILGYFLKRSSDHTCFLK
ncbi:MAG: hypothetical protein HQL13_04695 [Candidatus Omnitrophica bacterium]|nr:hypothetical protein [Candidatus Omnitrophota bacterium]